jgi:hypothetical protein
MRPGPGSLRPNNMITLSGVLFCRNELRRRSQRASGVTGGHDPTLVPRREAVANRIQIR